ncbi:MAG TPA: HWE histidine kinase domain-containing protein [Allosphingosinicella sp.]|jgi:PAS domain S-box-containing protein
MAIGHGLRESPPPPADPLEALRPVLETALDAVVVMTSEGDIAAWNAVAEATFGWSAEEAVGRSMGDLLVPPQYREAHCEGLRRYNRTGEERVLNRRIEISALHRDARELPVELSITKAKIAGETLFIGFLRDISRRRADEERLRRQAQEMRLLFEVTSLAAETHSTEEALRACLEAICGVTGWPVGHALVVRKGGQSELVSTSVWHEAEPGVAGLLQKATAAIRFFPGVGLPGRILETGEPIWIPNVNDNRSFARKGLGFEAAFGFPIKSGGRILAVLEFFARTAAEPDPSLLLTVRTLGEQVGRVLERKRTEGHQRLLINELNHRVKNTLAIVQSLAAQTLKGEGVSPETRAALESRLAALAAAHDLLTAENWEAAPLRQVIEEAGLGCGVSRSRFHVDGPPLRLPPKTAVSVAMAIHELCTNAVKYGALSNETGQVSVEWEIGGSDLDRRLTLCWREKGGPPVSEPLRKGFGTRLIERGLAADLGGSARIEFLPDGVLCTVEAPVEGEP